MKEERTRGCNATATVTRAPAHRSPLASLKIKKSTSGEEINRLILLKTIKVVIYNLVGIF